MGQKQRNYKDRRPYGDSNDGNDNVLNDDCNDFDVTITIMNGDKDDGDDKDKEDGNVTEMRE